MGATALALVAGAFGTAAAAAETVPRSAEAAQNERVQVLNAWKSGGDSTKEAAAKALIGTDAQIHTFLTSELGPLVEEDGRVAVLKILGNAGPGVRGAAQQALSGTPDDLSMFLANG
ncbi:ALF repeat-containing protein [Streptomyces anulatus]